ncbi:hypothetical protein Mal64_38790 [Pseudobythopirellula maris]|uniref:Uncharacterized protein n=1 Tax=Pseudobythopirellula maris TaxID=2527991 RepID=A0A5C5ZFA8_9BACT|nr:hypothetical protein [Pseudobythopirellula maris]TWT86139.1 hypothetical protein Mal64_38790 [Pseudobythopirellula maris]
MNNAQRLIAVVTLLTAGVFLHFFFCEWKINSGLTLDSSVNGYGKRTIVSLGSNTGVVFRPHRPSPEPVDAICGVAVPLMLTGGALFLAAGGRRAGRLESSQSA